jgi:tetratricopeptide (TPR) repeat protein
MSKWCALLALLILGTAKTGQAQPQQTANPTIRVGLLGETWTLVFDAPGYKVERNGLQSDDRVYLLAENQSTGVTLSVNLEKVSGQATIDDCKKTQNERLAQKVDYKREKIEARESAGMEILEYTIPEFRGAPVQQRNLFACMARDDVYVDIHLSKALFKTEQEPLLSAVLASAHFAENSSSNAGTVQLAPSDAGSGTSLDYFREGSRYFLKQDFAASVAPYQKAVEAEKQSRELSKDYWRVLIDNLGMAYGITGDLDHAEQTLNYGLSQDPTYPMFYYNLACVAAGRNNMDKTMQFLQRAFSYKANTIPNESMPDPRKDDSFKAFMADKRFQEFLDTL